MNHLRRTTLAASAAVVMLLAVGACSDDESVFNAEVGECIETIPTGNVSTLDETSNEVLAEMTWFPRNRSWDGRAVGVFRVAHDGGSRGRPDVVVNDAPENGRP